MYASEISPFMKGAELLPAAGMPSSSTPDSEYMAETPFAKYVLLSDES